MHAVLSHNYPVSGLNLGGLQFRPPITLESMDEERPTNRITQDDQGLMTSVRLTGLRPDTAYRVFVAASTEAGHGEPIFLDMRTLPAGSKKEHWGQGPVS